AFYTSAMQLWLFENIASDESLMLDNSEINFSGTPEVKRYFEDRLDIRSRIHLSRYQDNTAITYDNHFFLKVYRKVELGINPDQELSKQLSLRAQFKYVPRYLGSIEWKFRKGIFVLGMLQVMVENHGDGYSYMLERVNNYIERILAAKK